MYNDIEVSVIVPCYNAEKYIIQTLKSLENQIYKNFEVIIINDGSKDLTEKVIKEYIVNSNLKVNYKKIKNSGVSTARNIGISYAKGTYIVFLDSDDIYHKEYVKALYNAIELEKNDVAYCCYSREVEEVFNGTDRNEEKQDILLSHIELMRNFMYRKGPSGFWSFIYKKSIIENKKIEFNKNLKYGEDTQFTWKYLVHCNKGKFINRKLYGYRDNEFSAVNNISWNIIDSVKAVEEVEKYLEKYNDEFSDEFNEYMKYRTIWAAIKDFSKCENKELYNRTFNEYDVKKAMKQMIFNSNDIRIKITSAICCLNKNLFYNLIKRIS